MISLGPSIDLKTKTAMVGKADKRCWVLYVVPRSSEAPRISHKYFGQKVVLVLLCPTQRSMSRDYRGGGVEGATPVTTAGYGLPTEGR